MIVQCCVCKRVRSRYNGWNTPLGHELHKMAKGYPVSHSYCPECTEAAKKQLASGKRTVRACGNPQCSTSTGICDSLTFGSGKLDQFGYWEIPCAICARAFEKEHPEYGPCWPFDNSNDGAVKLLSDLLDLNDDPIDTRHGILTPLECTAIRKGIEALSR